MSLENQNQNKHKSSKSIMFWKIQRCHKNLKKKKKKIFQIRHLRLSQIKKKNQSIPGSLFTAHIISYLKRTGEKKIK